MKLFGVVVHAGGSSYSGHYYSYVRVGEAWFKVIDWLSFRWTTAMSPSAQSSLPWDKMPTSSCMRGIRKANKLFTIPHRSINKASPMEYPNSQW